MEINMDSIIPIPNLQIDEVNVLFDMEIKETERVTEERGCECCEGNNPLFYDDSDNCMFVNSVGELFIIVKGNSIKTRVKYCPNCGRVL